MAGSADREYLRDADPNPDLDEVASPPVAPDAASTLTPSTLTSVTVTTPAAHPIGSSAAPGYSAPGMTFHNATQVPVDDVWQSGLKASASLAPGMSDLAAAQSGLLAGINSGQFSGATLGHVQAILSDITTAISAANAAVNTGSVPGAEHVLRASQLSILNTVTTDPALANPAPQTEVAEPAAATETATPPPAAADDNQAEAETAENTDAVTPDDVTAAVQALLEENPDLFSGLTTDEVDTIMQAIQLELAHINDGSAAPESMDDLVAIVTNPATITAQQHVNVLQDTPISPPNATPIDETPFVIVTAEAPAIADPNHAGAPEPESLLHIIWG